MMLIRNYHTVHMPPIGVPSSSIANIQMRRVYFSEMFKKFFDPHCPCATMPHFGKLPLRSILRCLADSKIICAP